MGQAGSQPASGAPVLLHRRAHTLPHEPPRLAPKVLPSLTESPILRSTDNGAILHSGGTISGRRPSSHLQHPVSRIPHAHNMHMGVYRSRSAGAGAEGNDLRARERDPLHRSYTNLDLRHNDGSMKRFGSEPDLRIEEEQKRPKCNNKHFRKKYRAPPPPCADNRGGSSPDSSDGNAKVEPQRKLRLFKTRNETKKCNGFGPETKIPQYRRTDCINDTENLGTERRFMSPYKPKDNFKYPDSRDMMQTSASKQKEQHILQPTRQDYKKRIDRIGGCRAKTSKTNEHSEAWKTPLLNRNFRHSERFRKEESETPTLRREKSFDVTLMSSGRESESPKINHDIKIKSVKDEIRTKPSLLANSKPIRKSLPSLLPQNIEDKDEFRAELKKATTRIRNELLSKANVSEKKTVTSQIEKPIQRPNGAVRSIAAHNKVSESSPRLNNYKNAKDEANSKIANSRRPLTRNDNKVKSAAPSVPKCNKVAPNNLQSKSHPKAFPDRGQASGKESTPEHSPTRKNTAPPASLAPFLNHHSKEKTKAPAPSKQFYFGMIEPKTNDKKDNLKDFPGLGSPIIEEITNFHLIEKKLLGYRDEDEEFENFNAKLRASCRMKNLSSESALSSDGSDAEGSDGSLGIALRLRPTLPKKQPAMPRFSPAAAWKQLATLDAHLAAETQPLAVETKVSCGATGESSPRSDQSADKSGDSGISGDHANSDPRLDSPAARHHTDTASPNTWTPQQDLGDSSSDGAGGAENLRLRPDGLVTYSARGQPFSLSLPREPQDKGKQLQQGFNSLQKLRKSVSGALGAALGSRRFDLEHEPMLEEPEQNWFLTKSAPTSLSNPLMFPTSRKVSGDEEFIKEESPPPLDKEDLNSWRPGASYLSWGGHVMYLPPAPNATRQPLSLLGPLERPVRSKSSGELEIAARAARAARAGQLAGEMRERERSASPGLARAVPARVESTLGHRKPTLDKSRGKRFTFQSTVRQLERRRLAEKLSKEADLKEQQRKTELEAMRRVEEEFQRKRAREKANIRQQLRLVSGAQSMPHSTNHKSRDEPDGSLCRESPHPERVRESHTGRQRHSNASSETSGRSKSTTPIRSIELSEWRVLGGEARQYRDWAAAPMSARPPPAHAHPPACATMPIATPALYHATETEAFSGSPRSDNYRLEFARGVARSPRTPRPPRLLTAPRSPSTSGSELSMRQPIKISRETTHEEAEEDAIVPTIRPSGPSRCPVAIH